MRVLRVCTRMHDNYYYKVLPGISRAVLKKE